MLKRLLHIVTLGLALAFACAQAAPHKAAHSAKSNEIDFSAADSIIDLKGALTPYHSASSADNDGTHWYLLNAANNAAHPVSRILQAAQPPGAAFKFLPASTRPEILQAASSESGVTVENAGSYGRKSFLVTLPPATSASIALRLYNAQAKPSLLAWTEPALAAHNRQLAIFIAAVAGLIAAAAIIIAGVAVMTGHIAPRWAAILAGLILLSRLAAAGLFDASLSTGIGGPYGLSAMLACLALVAGARLVNAIVPFDEVWPAAELRLTWAIRALVALALLALMGIPGAALFADLAVVAGTVALAAYLVWRARAGVRAAWLTAPSAAVFALVTLAAAIAALGGFGTNPMAPVAIGGFAAVGVVLLALTIAAGEGIALISPVRHPQGRGTEAFPTSDDVLGDTALSAISAARHGVFDLDFSSSALTLSRDASVLLEIGDAPIRIPHSDWLAYLHPDDEERYTRALTAGRDRPDLPFRLEFRVRKGKNHFTWFELRAAAMGEAAPAERCLGLLAAIAARKDVVSSGADQPLRDPLTGLGNRLALVNALERSGDDLARTHLALIDIDRFKSIHFSLGDKDGDTLLADLAQRLSERLDPSDALFRIGGDAFAMLSLTSKDAAALGERLLKVCAAPHIIGERTVFAPVSIGVATGADVSGSVELLKNGELALGQAKKQGGGCVRIYSSNLSDSAPHDAVSLENDLRIALQTKQIDVFYQPILRLADGTVAGFEALLRWHHPAKGIVSPADFIAHSETSGLIVALGRLALERALQDLGQWQRFFPSEMPLFVSVNLSRRQLRDSHFEAMLQGLLRRSTVKPETLKLEITESAIGADPALQTVMERIRGLGVGLAIDDFGTGLSTLGQLKQLPFDTLKVDKSFLSPRENAEEDTDGVVILASVVAMARDLGRTVIIEGIENEKDCAAALSLGCEFAQGYYFSQPLPPSKVLSFIAKHCDIGGPARPAYAGGA